MAAFICPSLISQELDTLVNIMKNEGTESKWNNTEILTGDESGIMADSNTAIDVYGLPEVPPAPEIPSQVNVPDAPAPDAPLTEDEEVYFEFYEGPDNMSAEEERRNGESRDDDKKPRSSKFEGHWAGVEIGLNNYFDEDFSLQREGDSWYMDIMTGRSMVVGLNFAQYSIGIVPGHAGLVTGMGFTFYNYFFDNDITIVNNNGVIEALNLAGDNFVRSKLAIINLRVPLLFEIQMPGFGDRAFIAAGITGSIRLDAHTKVVYKEGKEKTKDKNWDDFNLNAFRYGFTFRVGAGNSNIFVDYDITPLFSGDTEPVLYPFSIGFSATL